MNGYTKLWQAIISSSIWNEEDKIRIVWITMLAMADQEGIVHASVGGLAVLARVDETDTRKAIEVLSAPDDDSRSEEFEGRRIEKVPGGFFILNHEKYRNARNDEERKSYMRDYMRKRRAKEKEAVNINSKQSSTCVNPSKPSLAQAEAEAYKKPPTPLRVAAKAAPYAHTPCVAHCRDEIEKELAEFCNRLYRRKDETKWTEKEVRAFRKINDYGDDDLEAIKIYYAGTEYGRRDLQTFLNNFQNEIDRAKIFKEKRK